MKSLECGPFLQLEKWNQFKIILIKTLIIVIEKPLTAHSITSTVVATIINIEQCDCYKQNCCYVFHIKILSPIPVKYAETNKVKYVSAGVTYSISLTSAQQMMYSIKKHNAQSICFAGLRLSRVKIIYRVLYTWFCKCFHYYYYLI